MLIKKYQFKLFKLRPKSNTRTSGKVLKKPIKFVQILRINAYWYSLLAAITL